MAMPNNERRMTHMRLPDSEWKKKKRQTPKRRSLTPEQFKVLRKKGTEAPFTGKLLYNKESGIYTCAGCGAPIFSSDKKFDSGTGWPSFWEPIKGAVEVKEDKSLFTKRTEVICKKCGGHLGHVFNDAPQTPSGMRYCINSCTLEFDKKK